MSENVYRCPECGGDLLRDSADQTVPSHCLTSGKDVLLERRDVK